MAGSQARTDDTPGAWLWQANLKATKPADAEVSQDTVG